MKIYSYFFTSFVALALCTSSMAQVLVNDDGSTARMPANQPVGKKEAQKYMNTSVRSVDDSHFLGLHIGAFADDKSYRWGDKQKVEDVGKITAGVTYRVGEWTSSMDLLIRADFNTYNLGESQSAVKLSILPMITFPDARADFPLYFGLGLGPGVFFKQIDDESSVALDYQLLAGIRFLDIVENTGFFFETGIKNHIHLLSDGQFNGVFAAFGTAFTF